MNQHHPPDIRPDLELLQPLQVGLPALLGADEPVLVRVVRRLAGLVDDVEAALLLEGPGPEVLAPPALRPLELVSEIFFWS